MSLPIFKARLKAKFNTSGKSKLSNERIDAFADKLHKKNPDLKDDDEKGHDDKIDELNEVVDFAKIATDDDRLRTAEAKLKEKTTKKDPEEEEEEEEEENEPAASGKNKNSQESKKKDRTPAWAKTLMDEVQSLKKEKQLSTIDSKIKSHEKLKDIPADFYEDYLKPEKEEDVDTFAEKVATKYATYKQVDKNNKATSQTKPVNSQTDTKGQADVKEVDAIMDNLMPGTKAPATAK